MSIIEDSTDFYSLSRGSLSSYIAARYNEPPFRAQQLFDWVYRKGVLDPKSMSNIAGPLRNQFASDFRFPQPITRSRQISSDGTRKYLFEVDQKDQVESVMIKQKNRMTLCLSSQVGCAMGCTFCKTGTMGLKRSLSASEIVRQVVGVISDAKNFGDRFTNVVFMGMGEPLHNWKGVSEAIRILKDQHAFGIGARRITVSTSGLIPGIRKFVESGLNVKLAVSLNATTDEVRSKIMPVNHKYPIEQLIGAIKELFVDPKRSVTMEYVMLGGVNDFEHDLVRLSKLLEGLNVKINLIPYNPNAGLGFSSPVPGKPEKWQRVLNSKGIISTIRWSKGADISAACGQLVTDTRKNFQPA